MKLVRQFMISSSFINSSSASSNLQNRPTFTWSSKRHSQQNVRESKDQRYCKGDKQVFWTQSRFRTTTLSWGRHRSDFLLDGRKFLKFLRNHHRRRQNYNLLDRLVVFGLDWPRSYPTCRGRPSECMSAALMFNTLRSGMYNTLRSKVYNTQQPWCITHHWGQTCLTHWGQACITHCSPDV